MADSPDMPLRQEDAHVNNERDTQAGHAASSDLDTFFKGPIPEAIASAQTENKILVVYIAGVDDDSLKLDHITWQDSKVLEVSSQQCVVLRLPHNSTDALHFSAIYPFRKIPSIALVSHTGLLLKQHEGYIAPAEFLASLQQAGATFHLRTAAASAMAAALASTGVSLSMPITSEQGQCAVEKLPATNEGSEHEQAGPSTSSSCTGISTTTSFEDVNHSLEALPSSSKDHEQMEDNPLLTMAGPSTAGPTEQVYATDRGFSPLLEETVPESNAFSESLPFDKLSSNLPGRVDASKVTQRDAGESCQSDLSGKSSKYTAGSVVLQIRLTNGNSIRGEFGVQDSLTAVKDFVDKNRTDGNRGYSLAIPYPRKIFSDEDMEKTLVELKLDVRATLILLSSSLSQEVHHVPSAKYDTSASTSSQRDGHDSQGFIWKVLSYLNPFAYFGGSPSNIDSTLPGSSSWQYGPDPAFGRSLRDGLPQQRDVQHPNFATPYNASSNVERGESSGNSSNSTQKKGWGGNIHTLRHDEDESFKKGNAFWNGNSTQFGADDPKKK